MTLKEKRAAAFAKAKEYQARIKAGEQLTEDDVAAVKGLLSQIDDLDGQIAKAAASSEVLDRLGALKQAEREESSAGDGGVKAASLGEHFIKSMESARRSLKDPGQFAAPLYKAEADTHVVGTNGGAYGPLVTDIDRTPVTAYRRPLLVADLFGSGTLTGNAITYPVFDILEGQTAFVSEAGQKPQLHLADPKWQTDALTEIAGFFKISDDMAEDIPYVVSEINTTAIYNLQLNEELALLTGDGMSPNLKGVLNREGVQTVAKGSDTVADAVFKAIANVQTATGFNADGIVMNPADYQELRLSKDSNGQYYGGGFFAGEYGNGGITMNPPLWGLRTVTTPSIAKGTVLVGAFTVGGKVFRKGGLRVESTNSHVDDFTNDRITVRVRERIALQVKYPAAFVKVTLGG